MPNSNLHLGTCRKATTWDRRLYFSSEGRRAEDIFALKIRRLWPGVNPLPLDTEAAKATLLSRFVHPCYTLYKPVELYAFAQRNLLNI